MNYPTDGARVFAETGKSKFQIALDEGLADAGLTRDEENTVGLLANFIMNTSPGYRPSDAAHYAVRIFQQGGMDAVRRFGGRS